MYNKLIYLLAFITIMMTGSCELDNYEGPDATVFGSIIDSETGELVGQDIINGAQIEYIEHGYDNPATQYMIIKNDGTYRNNLMFSGMYTIKPVRGNFVPMEEAKEIKINGDTELNFEVQPYIRIGNFSLNKEGEMVVATFTVSPTVPNKVQKIGLYGHPEASVGEPIRTLVAEKVVDSVVEPGTEFSLEIKLPSDLDENQLYFRVGALIDAPEAKLNYAPAEEMDF